MKNPSQKCYPLPTTSGLEKWRIDSANGFVIKLGQVNGLPSKCSNICQIKSLDAFSVAQSEVLRRHKRAMQVVVGWQCPEIEREGEENWPKATDRPIRLKLNNGQQRINTPTCTSHEYLILFWLSNGRATQLHSTHHRVSWFYVSCSFSPSLWCSISWIKQWIISCRIVGRLFCIIPD